MSDEVQSIVEAVQSLDAAQRRELTAALAAIELPEPDAANNRKQLVDSIRGKYRHIPTSSESFMNRKREDTVQESRL
jgi:hypothetical protein